MNSLDIYISIPIIIGIIIGFSKGLIKEIIGITILVGGVWLAKIFHHGIGSWLAVKMDISEKTANVLAFIGIFIVVAITLSVLGKILEKAFETIALGGLNKLIGALFGGFKYALIISLLLNTFVFFEMFGKIISEEDKAESFLYKSVSDLAPKIWNELIPDKKAESEENLKNI